MFAKDHQPLPHPSTTLAGRHTTDELADMVKALRAENAKLREALDKLQGCVGRDGYVVPARYAAFSMHIIEARAALASHGKD